MERTVIPLPDFSRGNNCRAHPHPIKISYQTMEFIQTSVFYNSLVDIMTGEYIRISKGIDDVRAIMIQEGLTEETWDKHFSFFEKYKPIFERQVFQNVLISIRSHWDWYIRQTGCFISFARQHVQCNPLSRKYQDKLDRIAFLPIQDQIDVLEKSCDISLSICSKDKELLKEMSLVRNLGLHNRWEVDKYYVDKTSSCTWTVGELRIFNSNELNEWHACLIKTVKNTGLDISVRFVDAPNYTK